VKKIVGLSVGIALAVITTTGLLVLLLRRRNRRGRERVVERSQEASQMEARVEQIFEADNCALSLKELDGRMSRTELDSGSSIAELPPNSIVELPTNSRDVEYF
jgi:hypothetical protein